MSLKAAGSAAVLRSLVGDREAILHTAAVSVSTLVNVLVHTAHFFCFNCSADECGLAVTG